MRGRKRRAEEDVHGCTRRKKIRAKEKRKTRSERKEGREGERERPATRAPAR